MLAVVALGGNAVLGRGIEGAGSRRDIESQRARLRTFARDLAVFAQGRQVVITHGNGPQVGHLAAAHALAHDDVRLDVIGAESDGMLGYLIELEVANELAALGDDREVVTVLTEVVVDADDPAFLEPTKPIGPTVDAATVRRFHTRRDWTFRAVSGPPGAPSRWRRVVPSPPPLAIVQERSIARLVEGGTIVVCAGGGGIPISLDRSRRRHGVEAVVDKDLTSTRLAVALGADRLILLTDVDAVYDGFGSESARPLAQLGAAEALALELEPGSMAPKVRAAAEFALASRGVASIGSIDALATLAEERCGTHIRG